MGDLGVVGLTGGALIPIETMAAEQVAVDIEGREVNRLVVGLRILVARVPGVVGPN